MDLVQRVSFVRAMLFALSSPRGEDNFLMRDSTIASRKRQRKDGQEGVERTTTTFALKGRRVYLQAFAAVTQLSTETIRRHAMEVAGMSAPEIYKTSKSNNRAGTHGVQRVVVKAFLIGVANDFEMECPRGRGSKDESPLRILPSQFTKKKLYDDYLDECNMLCAAVVERVSLFSMPEWPVVYNLFVRHWKKDMPFLRTASTGSDFCHTCTTLRDTLETLEPTDVHVLASRAFLEDHLSQARTEFRLYKDYQQVAGRTCARKLRHFVFDYAENVLLPRLQKQPGQLHFITGLKFDFFGVSSSNKKKIDIYGLVEGFWPREKTANTVISMVHHSIDIRSPRTPTGRMGERLVLHADNCSGQNKNRYTLFYIVWRAMVGLEDEITLLFLVAGHTKNVCDGSFGHIKRRLLNTDVG